MCLTIKTESKLALPRRIGSLLGSMLLAVVLCLLLVLALSWARMVWVEEKTPQQAAPQPGRWLRAHDVDIYIQEFGSPTAPPLLLTHGTGAWSGTWDQNVQALAASGYRVIAMDLPPFGFSTRPTSRDYSRAAQALRIAGLIDALKLGPVTLLGHSYGGGPAAEAAMRQPDRVSHLILLDAAIGLKPQMSSAPTKPDVGVAAAVLDRRPVRTALIATVGTQPLFSEFWLRQFVARKEVVTAQRTAIYRQPFVVHDFSASLGDWAAQFASEHGAFLSEQPDGFSKLVMPLTLVWGELDSITPLSQAETIRKLVPSAKLVVLPGVGHIPQIENAALFNQAMGVVLRR